MTPTPPDQQPSSGVRQAGPIRRGPTPLFWTHVAPYGKVKLDMTRRLALSGTATAAG